MPAFAPIVQPYKTIILANGDFPVHPVALSLLRNAACVVCCDGAAEQLLNFGMEPHHIVGDLDSLSSGLQDRYRSCLHHDPDQESNDLTKAVHFCVDRQLTEITILGATGKREDHTIANISLLFAYAQYAHIQMVTNFGVFVQMLQSTTFESFPKQQVSVFSGAPEAVFTFHGLKYPLHNAPLLSLWQGALNEASGKQFTIETKQGTALVFRQIG